MRVVLAEFVLNWPLANHQPHHLIIIVNDDANLSQPMFLIPIAKPTPPDAEMPTRETCIDDHKMRAADTPRFTVGAPGRLME